MISKKYLKSIISYSKESGVFVWKKVKVKNQIKKGSVAGYIDKKGYIRIQIDGKNYMAHKLAWLYEYGILPDMIDHINQVKSDNRIENLRIANSSENAKNRKICSNNTSGCMGVTWCKSSNRWVSRITIDGKRINLGRYAVYCDAVNARKNAEALYGYHPNHNKSNDEIRETLLEIQELYND